MNAEDKDRPVGEDYRGQPRIHISVQQVAVHGKGAILLTGPSSCGKGELANSLCRFLFLPSRCHISMGDVLRETIEAARQDSATREMLREGTVRHQ
jgi:adenylylsulfate kinase-like enzyme